MPGISTVVLHADREVHPTRAVAPPIYQTATFWAEDAEQFARAAVDRRGQDFYTRFDAWLLLRGLRTLPLRVARHNVNGQALAEALGEHPAVARVHYPGLATHPQHTLAGSQMSGFGGVLGIELADALAAADAVAAAVAST